MGLNSANKYTNCRHDWVEFEPTRERCSKCHALRQKEGGMTWKYYTEDGNRFSNVQYDLHENGTGAKDDN